LSTARSDSEPELLNYTTSQLSPTVLLRRGSTTDFQGRLVTCSNMSIIPPPLARRSSTWSILRSLDALSPPPSWSSLDNLTACCQVGSIPLIFHAGVGVGDLPNLINGACSDTERDDSSPMDPFDREYKGGSILDNKTVSSTEHCIYHKSPKQRLASRRTEPFEETHSMESPTQAMLLPHPQCTPSSSPKTPETSPEKPRRVVSAHATPENPPTSCYWSSGPQSTPPGSSPRRPEPGKLSECQGSSGHKRKDSTSTTDSGLSSRSNLSFAAHDANRVTLENAIIGAVRFPLLPASLSWLQSTTLEIMIDQEGFRMIKPVFRFAGYSRPTSMESDVISLDVHLVSATADFMPLQRKSFAFHHSALETPPVLRRLMVNGDRSRDFLSRQAYLVLKANGPYTVQGTEPVQSSRLLSAAQPSVLVWRFDYFVGDRRTETGRIIPGEKTLTPLSFTCSPALLQPTQAKKIRVVQVVKKSVAAKLTATKMEPPMPPSPRPPVPGATPFSIAGSELRETATRNDKRVHSNVLRDTLTLGISTIHDTAQLTCSGGAFLPISESP